MPPGPTAMSGLRSTPASGRRWPRAVPRACTISARYGRMAARCAWPSATAAGACAPSSRCRPSAGRLSFGRRPSPAGAAARARHARSLWGSARSVCPIRGPGSIMGAGQGGRARRATNSCRPRARACTRYPVGPVHAGIIEPGHFRFTANGETVVRLEERLGYAHKGVEGLMAGAEIEQRRADRRAHLGRQHGGLRLGFRPRRRGRARLDAAAARGAAARRHGRAGASVAPHQRCRRDLQRRQRAHHPRPLHPAARGCAGAWPMPASAIG